MRASSVHTRPLCSATCGPMNGRCIVLTSLLVVTSAHFPAHQSGNYGFTTQLTAKAVCAALNAHTPACNYTSKHPANLRSHMKNKHSKKPSKPRKGVVKRCQAVSCHRTYQCSECPEAFVREDSLRSHCRLHLKGILPPAALPQASEEAAQVTSESLDTVAEDSTILQPSRENCNEQEIDPACLVPALSTATFTVCTASEQVQPLCQPQVDSMGTSQILECLVQDPVTVEFLPDKQLVFLASGQDSTSASTTNLPLLVSALQPAFWASPPVAPLENST
ncbi:hypothetical protein MRX96_015154 [Rhipicephalus microplus]